MQKAIGFLNSPFHQIVPSYTSSSFPSMVTVNPGSSFFAASLKKP